MKEIPLFLCDNDKTECTEFCHLSSITPLEDGGIRTHISRTFSLLICCLRTKRKYLLNSVFNYIAKTRISLKRGLELFSQRNNFFHLSLEHLSESLTTTINAPANTFQLSKLEYYNTLIKL